MKRIYLLCLLFIIGCGGAPTNKTEDVFVIPIDYENSELIPFSKSGLKLGYELIPLYADTSSFYAPIPGPQIKAYKNYLYLFQNAAGKFRIFDKNGKFIKNLPNGKGPGELEVRFIDFCFNGDTLFIFQLTKISLYDLKGNHIRDVRTKENLMSYSDVYRFNDYSLIYSTQAFEKNFVQIINSKSNNVVTQVIPKKENPENYNEDVNNKQLPNWLRNLNMFSMPQLNNRFFECNENLYFCIPMSDCVYRINKGDSIPYVYMKIGNLFNAENVEAMNQTDMQEYIFKKKLFSDLSSMLITDDGNLISFRLLKRAEAYITGKYKSVYV